MSDEEYLDLVDENDVVVGRELRSEIYKNGQHNYRVVNAFIVNSEGKLWIPRRTKTKSIAPLGLDFSVGGHVESGSDYVETLKKEAREELNIDIQTMPFKEVGYFKPGESGLSSFMKVYEIASEVVPVFNQDDFVEYYWLTPQEFVRKIESGDTCKGDLLILVKLIYLK